MSRTSTRDRRQRGQSMVEYAVITAAILGFSVMGWPFIRLLVNALDAYFQGIYYVLQSPLT
ncbi:MAG: hypothetical protein IRZ16_13955 [Myxococcaceae bacterium]|nr:hypothetical protein [Myxococcaceae bacterium]